MIRRLLIVIGLATVLVGGMGLLSDVWQFGYVGSWASIGLREGKLWYVRRANPIFDGEGFYVDDASDYNRAMYSISMGARFRDKRVGPRALGVLAGVAYALILPPILRRWKRPAPRWLLATLVPMCVLLAALWMTSHIVTIAYYGSDIHLRLADGIVSMNIQDHRPYLNLGWGQGWVVQRRLPVSFINFQGYFSWRGGRIMANLPLGAMLVVLPVPTIVLVRRARQLGPNQCKRCSYDLTGNVSGVCPECGTKCQNVETSKSQNAETT